MTPSSSHSGPKRSNNHESCIEGGYHRRVTSPKADHADSKLEEPETAFQSHKLDRQVTDHAVRLQIIFLLVALIGKVTAMIGELPISKEEESRMHLCQLCPLVPYWE